MYAPQGGCAQKTTATRRVGCQRVLPARQVACQPVPPAQRKLAVASLMGTLTGSDDEPENILAGNASQELFRLAVQHGDD